MKWGRFTPVMDTQTADLVITVRKGSGKMVQPTIGGLPTNDRPVVVQPTDSGIRLGGRKAAHQTPRNPHRKIQVLTRELKLGLPKTCLSYMKAT